MTTDYLVVQGTMCVLRIIVNNEEPWCKIFNGIVSNLEMILWKTIHQNAVKNAVQNRRKWKMVTRNLLYQLSNYVL